MAEDREGHERALRFWEEAYPGTVMPELQLE